MIGFPKMVPRQDTTTTTKNKYVKIYNQIKRQKVSRKKTKKKKYERTTSTINKIQNLLVVKWFENKLWWICHFIVSFSSRGVFFFFLFGFVFHMLFSFVSVTSSRLSVVARSTQIFFDRIDFYLFLLHQRKKQQQQNCWKAIANQCDEPAKLALRRDYKCVYIANRLIFKWEDEAQMRWIRIYWLKQRWKKKTRKTRLFLCKNEHDETKLKSTKCS